MDTVINMLDRNSSADNRSMAAMHSESPRLRNWLRRNSVERADIEDLLQDVFIELVLANRAARTIEDVGAWMFKVARNRLLDIFRSKAHSKTDSLESLDQSDTAQSLVSLLPDAAAGPEAQFARTVLVEHLIFALDQLPAEQREIYLAHELEGQSFSTISARTGIGVNTLLARKLYAVRKLRDALADHYHDHLTD